MAKSDKEKSDAMKKLTDRIDKLTAKKELVEAQDKVKAIRAKLKGGN